MCVVVVFIVVITVFMLLLSCFALIIINIGKENKNPEIVAYSVPELSLTSVLNPRNCPQV